MAEKVELQIGVQDDASKTIDKIAGKAEDATAKPYDIDIRLGETPEGDLKRVTEQAKETADRVKDIGQKTVTIRMSTDQVEQAEKAITEVHGELKKVDAETVDVTFKTEDLDTFNSKLKQSKVGVEETGGAAEKSKSALANMVGNSAQDLGELGGIAGSSGVAIGQMAEYMSDAALAGGSLSAVLGSFATVAVPIAALSIGIGLITSAFQAQAEEQKRISEASQKLADDISSSFEKIKGSAESGTGGATDFVTALGAAFLATNDKAGQFLLALQALNQPIDNIGASLEELETKGDRITFFQDFLANSSQVSGATSEITDLVGRLIQSYGDVGEVSNAAYRSGIQGAGQFVDANKDVIQSLFELKSAAQGINIDETVKDTKKALIDAKGGTEAWLEALKRVKAAGQEVTDRNVLSEALGIYNSLANAAQRWGDANRDVKSTFAGTPELWQQAAAGAHALTENQKLTQDQQDAINGLMRTYGLTLEDVLSNGLDLWGDNEKAAEGNKDAIKKAAGALHDLERAWDEATESGDAFADVFGQQQQRAFAVHQAYADVEDGVAGLAKAVKDAGTDFQATGGHLTTFSEDGRKVLDAVQSLGGAIGKSLSAELTNAGGNFDTVREKAAGYRDELIQQLTQLGLNSDSIQGYIEFLGLTPEQVETTIVLSKQAEARKKIADLNVDIANLPKEAQTDFLAAYDKGDFVSAYNVLYNTLTNDGKGITTDGKLDPSQAEASAAAFRAAEEGHTITWPTAVNTEPAKSSAAEFRRKEEADAITIPVRITRGEAQATMAGSAYTQPGVYRVGEAGPETVVLPGGAQVLTAGRTQQLEGRGQQVIQNTYNITVNVPVGAPTAAVGRYVTDAIDAYERVGGRRRRAVA